MTSQKFTGHAPHEAAFVEIEQAAEEGTVREVPFHLQSRVCGDAESQRRHHELLTALTAAGVHAYYDESSACPGWRVTHVHAAHLQDGTHACSTGGSPQHPAHACGDAISSTGEVREPCGMHAEMAAGDFSCTASSESARTTAGGADCRHDMHVAASHDADSATSQQCLPRGNLLIGASAAEGSNCPQRDSSCVLHAATVAAGPDRGGSQEPQHSSAQRIVPGWGSADVEGEDGSDEKVLHHLALAQQALAEFIHSAGDMHEAPAPALAGDVVRTTASDNLSLIHISEPTRPY